MTDKARYLSISYLDQRDKTLRQFPTIDTTSQEQLGDAFRTVLSLWNTGRINEKEAKEIKRELIETYELDIPSYFINEDSISGSIDGLLDDLGDTL